MTCDIIILCANLDPSFRTGQVITCKMFFSGLGKTCVKKFCFRLLVAKGLQLLTLCICERLDWVNEICLVHTSRDRVRVNVCRFKFTESLRKV